MQNEQGPRTFLGGRVVRRALRAAVILSVAAVTLTSGPRSVAHLSAADVLRAGMDGTGVHAALADTTPVLEWQMMAGLDYRSGQMTSVLRQLDGKQVRIPGFIVPLEDTATEVTEFLLVPYVGACVHVPPPPPNQLVYVQMTSGKKATVDWWNPIWIHGRLSIATVESVYGAVGFQLEGVRIEPYEF
jgi:hypothetical protein